MLKRLVLAGLVLAVCAPLVFADAPKTGVVTGTVVDPDGAALPGATVRLVTEQGDMTSISNADGEFRFVFIAPGDYTVRADLEGFQSTEGIITVSAGGRTAVELRLGGVVGGEIVVTGETPLVNRYDVTGGGALTTEEMTQVPAVGRFYLSNISFLPGVTNDFQSQRYWGFNPEVEGNTGGRNSFFLDGVDVSFARQAGGTRLLVASFAVAETKLEATGADAQYGRMIGGAVSTVLRSGTNQWHGEAVWYARNLDWDENYEVTPVLMPDERKDSYEISLGGPIVRDKLWFFVADSERNAPVAAVLPSGEFYDQTVINESTVAKLDFRPSASHSLTLTYLESPFTNPGNTVTGAELATTWIADWGGDFFSLGWDWAISDSLFLETKVAAQNTITNRIAPHESIDPSADPNRPAGNNWTYRDQLTRLYWNGYSSINIGDVEFPRDQFNTSLNWFSGAHDVKAGLDYQEVEWQSVVATRPRVQGRGYNPDLPGGYATPLYVDKYYGTAEGDIAINPTENLAVYVRDRMSFNRWTFNLGLRYESQTHENDFGAVTVDDSAVYPRLNAVYDVKGDGSMLLSGTAGRYMYQIPQDWSANFNASPTGRARFDRWGWNPATEAYDRLVASNPPAEPGGDVAQVGTTHKDELTFGFDWAFHPDWAFKVKAVYWEMNDTPTIYEQQDAAGAVISVAEKNPWATGERNSFHFTLTRRFKNNWMVGAGYSYSSTEGTCELPPVAGLGCSPQVGELIDVVDPDTGVPYSLQNYDGRFFTDRPHVFKGRGMYLMPLGKRHTLNIGAYFSLQDGAAYALTAVRPVLDGAASIFTYLEPRGSKRNPRQKELNLNLEWQFPIVKTLEGAVRLEAVNVTNEQVLIGTLGLTTTGNPMPTSATQPTTSGPATSGSWPG
jgi:hypothetical protein